HLIFVNGYFSTDSRNLRESVSYQFESNMREILLSFCALAVAFNCSAGDVDASRAALRERLEKAEKAEANENFRAAHEIYSSATRDFPDFSEAWAGLGEHLRFYSHDLKAAEDAFEKSIAAKNQDANAVAFSWRG